MIINNHNLAVASHVAKTSLRPVLNCVYFTSKVSVATDSYRLLEVELPDVDINDMPVPLNEKSDDPVLLPINALAKIKIPKVSAMPILSNAHIKTGEGTATISVTDLETTDSIKSRIVDSSFPDYERIIPTEKPVVTIHLNAKYLKEMADYFAKHEKDGKVLIDVYSDDKPLQFRGSTEEDQVIRGIIMPCRVE